MNKQMIVFLNVLVFAVTLNLIGIYVWVTKGISYIIPVFTLSGAFVIVVGIIINYLCFSKSRNVNMRKVTNWFISEWRASQWLDLTSAFYVIPCVVYLLIIFFSEDLFKEI